MSYVNYVTNHITSLKVLDVEKKIIKQKDL